MLIVVVVTFQSKAQSPQGINYQGVARDLDGKALSSQNIAVRISILKNGTNSEIEFAEIHSVKTNAFGLFMLVIGQGNVTIGSFQFVSWAIGQKWLQIELDPTGGSSFQLLGSQQLMSVPYAFYANYSGNGLTAGQGIKIVNNQITNTGDSDNSAINELITSLTFGADKKLKITDAGGTKEADLSSLSVGSQSLANVLLTGNDAGNQKITNLAGPTIPTDAATKLYVDNHADADNNSSNEIQDLSLNGHTLSLTQDATTINLLPYLDNTDSQNLSSVVVGTNRTITITGGTGTTIDVADNDNDPTNELQSLNQVLTKSKDAGGLQIKNLGTPTVGTDATSKVYVDDAIATAIATNYAFKATYSFINTGGTFSDSPINLSKTFDDFNVVGSNKFTAPVAGTYQFTVSGNSLLGGIPVKLKITSGTISLYDVKRQPSYPLSSTINYMDSNIYKLNSGDTVELVISSTMMGERVDGVVFGYKL